MAENTIVTKILAIANKQEETRQEEISVALLEYLKYRFHQHLDGLSNWNAVDGEFFYSALISDLEIGSISKYDLETTGKKLGLNLFVKNDDQSFSYQIISTKLLINSTMSPAQKMLQDFNTSLLQRINLQSSIAEDVCKTILHKLNIGDFTSERNIKTNKWIITLTVNNIPTKLTNHFLNPAWDILEKNGLNSVQFYSDSTCKIYIPFEVD